MGARDWAEHLVHRAVEDRAFERLRPRHLDLHQMSAPVARYLCSKRSDFAEQAALKLRFCLLLRLRDEASLLRMVLFWVRLGRLEVAENGVEQVSKLGRLWHI